MLGDKQKENIWVNKAEALKAKQRNKNRIKSLGKTDFTQKMKDDLAHWHEKKDELTIQKIDSNIVRHTNASIRRN